MSLFKYYWNPAILTMSAFGYFSPLFIPLPSSGGLRFVVGNALAYLILLFVVSACAAWLVATIQMVMGGYGYAKRNPAWKHHVLSAVWTFVCYGVVIALFRHGYYLTA